jgi:hypothetical protein
MTVKVEVYHDDDHWCAKGIDVDVFTCAKSLDSLINEIQDAVACHFEEELKGKKSIEIIIHTKTEVGGAS